MSPAPGITSVLVVDDSAVVRQVVSAILEAQPDMAVQAAVADPIFAIQRMQLSWPDVIVLDVEMPRMDGITFLRRLMAERPTPVVVCSSLTVEGARTTLEALAAGAVAIVPKPRIGVRAGLLDASADLVLAVRAAARANLSNLSNLRRNDAPPIVSDNAPQAFLAEGSETVVAIGTSTGGTQALERVLPALPPSCPGIVIVQHMPEKFTAAFARRLDELCRITVKEAEDGDRVLPGHALVAPGGRQMSVCRDGARYRVEVRAGPPVNRHCPSVDVLFRSVARAAGRNALGVLMTGMGDDGARGLLEMREAGARTVAQDEASCVVYGMPREAVRLAAAQQVLPLAGLAGVIAAAQRS